MKKISWRKRQLQKGIMFTLRGAQADKPKPCEGTMRDAHFEPAELNHLIKRLKKLRFAEMKEPSI